ncbi:uncharacterized protein DS421_14g475960 [Arachis hypogaea]|nr:uncharacterized protein DS421_14g475960 [Arachis hypogaea]
MRTPPTLLSLTIDSAVINLSDFSDLSVIPDHILLDLFLVSFPPLFLLSFFSNFKLRTLAIQFIHSFIGDITYLALYSDYFFSGERILRAGKLTEKVLRLFIATGKDEVLSLVQALNIQHILTPVLPTRCSEKF